MMAGKCASKGTSCQLKVLRLMLEGLGREFQAGQQILAFQVGIFGEQILRSCRLPPGYSSMDSTG